MAFIALKPCSFGGERFFIGDSISTSLVQPEMVKRLIKMGMLAEVLEPEPEPNSKRTKSKKSGGD